jgi:hypothetical protein
LGWTGSKIQLVNGVVLLLTFFGARIVFGTYMSYRMWSKSCYILFKRRRKKWDIDKK